MEQEYYCYSGTAEQLEHEDEGFMELPPGFRFHPTDEEIITHYLTPKSLDHTFSAMAMAEIDLNKCEPWDTPSKAKMGAGEKEWYFFSQKDRKYPTGMRTNRATEAGYWKATGKDKEIYRSKIPTTGKKIKSASRRSSADDQVLVGMKKTLVFYRGRAPRGEKTNWVMHEFRLQGILPTKDKWVVCRVFHKNSPLSTSSTTTMIFPRMENDNSISMDDHHHHHQNQQINIHGSNYYDHRIPAAATTTVISGGGGSSSAAISRPEMTAGAGVWDLNTADMSAPSSTAALQEMMMMSNRGSFVVDIESSSAAAAEWPVLDLENMWNYD